MKIQYINITHQKYFLGVDSSIFSKIRSKLDTSRTNLNSVLILAVL